MRKSLGLTLVLLVLAIGTIYWGWNWVDQAKDKISVEERTLLGDKAAAAGLVLSNRITCDDHLFWDIATRPGTEEKSKVDFRFSQARQSDEMPRSQLWINIYANTNFGMSGNLDLAWEQENGMIMEPILDVAERTPAGGSREEVVALKDYYEYYPLTVDISFPNKHLQMNQETLQDLRSYFKIPVEEKHKIKVTIAKDETGAVVDVDCSDVERSLSIDAKGAAIEDNFYFTLDLQGYHEGKAVPTAFPPDLSGIHLLPLENLGDMGALSGDFRPKPKEMHLAYPFEQKDDRGLGLLATRDQKHLLLITEEKGTKKDLDSPEGEPREKPRIMLSVIEDQTMELRQKIELPRQSAGAGIWKFEPYDTFYLVMFDDYSFCLITEGGDEGYKIEMSGDFNALRQIDENCLPYGDTVMNYNGQKLAMAFYNEWRGGNPYLLIYEKAGLAYAGRYEYSSSRDPYVNHWLGLRPLYSQPLSLVWD